MILTIAEVGGYFLLLLQEFDSSRFVCFSNKIFPVVNHEQIMVRHAARLHPSLHR
jgi:hypothetical protein